MDFAQQLAALNESHFFGEFTYSKTTFHPAPSHQVELADAIIWIGSLLVIYQLKEREAQTDTTAHAEKRWFEKKVLGKATRQVRDTLGYLNAEAPIEIRNHRGHALALDVRSIRQLHKIIVYLPSAALPADCRGLKHHRSQTADLIHIIPAVDYLGMVQTLLTPAEVAGYLEFRSAQIDRFEARATAVPEQALVGQYLSGDFCAPPSVGFIEYVSLLEHRADEWDMSGIITKFPDRTIIESGQTGYYQIVRELALLKRNELREFKTRFQISLENSRANELVKPYRIAFPRTGCGFVFLPVTKETLPHRSRGLQNFTLAHKYEMRLPKCVGVSIADGADGWFTDEWLYLEFPWEQDAQLEEALRHNNPFREVRQAELPRYAYRDPSSTAHPLSPLPAACSWARDSRGWRHWFDADALFDIQ